MFYMPYFKFILRSDPHRNGAVFNGFCKTERYLQHLCPCGKPLRLTGAEAAERLLRSQGIYDVAVRRVSGHLTDHYDPRTKTVNLSDAVYGATSIAAIGVAAHECGHAMQDAGEYVPLRLRAALVPVANFGARSPGP